MISAGSFGVRGLPKTTTTYARYVGRVGALAVALGIGVAVGTWPAVAFAEPTDSETSASPTDTTSQVTDDAPAEAVAPALDPTPTPSTSDAAPQADPAPSTPDPRDGIVQASGGAEVRTSSDTTETTPSDPQPKADKRENGDPPPAEVSTPPTNFTEVTAQRVESSAETSPPSAVVDNVTAPSLVESATPVAVVAQDAPAPVSVAAATDPPPAEASDVVSSVAAGLAAVLNPFAANGEDAPADSPMAWTVLAMTRRWSPNADEGDDAEAFRTAASSTLETNHAPEQAPGAITYDPITGVLSGTMHFIDADGDPLTYYVLRSATQGTVVYQQDGTFSYTPTQAARLAAGQTPGPDRDTFALGASDGIDDGNAYFYAPISPAQFVLTPPLTGIDSPVSTVFSPDGTRAYVTAFQEHSVRVVDTATGAVIATIDVNTSPNGIAVSPDGSQVYTANQQGGLAVIVTANNSAGGIHMNTDSTNLALTPDGTRAYVTNSAHNTVTVIDLTTNSVITTLAGFHVPFHVTVSPDGTRAYVTNIANGPGEMSVIDTASNTVLESIRLGPANSGSLPYGFGFSPDGTRMYIADAGRDNITVLSTADNSVVDTITGITNPTALVVSPDGSLAYVASGRTNAVTIINTATHAIVATYQFADSPNDLAVSPDGSLVYVTRSNGDAVSVLTLVQKVNRAPVAGVSTYSTADPVTGAITGSLNFTDADNDPLTYTYSAASSRGTLVVNADGTFVYAPTEAARLVARTTAGLDLDVFTIVASDGSATAATVVSPTIDAARLVLSTPSTTAGGPVITAFTTDGSRAYVTGIHDSTIKVYDTSSNTLIASITVGGASEGVAVSPDGTRAYVAVAQGGIAIIDTASNTLLPGIPGAPGPTRIAITPDGTRAYVTNHSLNTVSVIDLTNNTFVDEIPGFNGPLDLAIGRNGARVYVTNTVNGPGSVMVIDTATNTVIDTIFDGPIYSGFQPYGFAESPDGSRLYIGDLSRNRVTVIDTATNAVVDHIGGLHYPTDVALSPDGSVLYAANQGDSSVSVIDIATKTVLATYSFGDYPYKLAANPNGTQVYIGRTNADTLSVLTLVSGENRAPVAGVPTYGSADAVTGAITGSLNFTDADDDPLTYTYSGNSTKGTLVLNPDGTFVYTPTQAARLGAYQTAGPDFASFAVTASDGLTSTTADLAPPVAPGRLELTTPLPQAERPAGIAFSPDGTRAFITLSQQHDVLVVDTVTNAVINTVHLQPTGVTYPIGIAVNPDGSRAYVANQNGGISVIDTANGTVLQTISLPNGSVRIAVSPDGTRGYVTNQYTNTVDVLDLTDNTFVMSIPDINVPHDVLVGRDGTRAYVITTANGPYSIRVIDTATNAVIDSVILRPQGYPTPFAGLTFSPDGSLLYTAAVQEGKVLALNTADNSVAETASGLNLPTAIALSPDGSVAYVATDGGYTITAIDVATGAVLSTYPLADNSYAMGVNPNGLNTYALPANDGPVSVLTFVSLPLNSAPLSGTPTYSAPDPITGAVTITPNFTDPDGDPLTYTVTAPPNGTVVVYLDGTVVYTPSPAARHAAAADGAPASALSDSVTITASDGIASTNLTVNPVISPANTAPIPTGVMTTVPGLENRASDFIMSADGSRAYVQLWDDATGLLSLAMVDTATNAVTVVPLNGTQDTLTNTGAYSDVVLSRDGTHLYAALEDPNTDEHFLAVVDTTNATVQRIAFPQVAQLHISPDGGHVYGLNLESLTILDTATNDVTSTAIPYGVYKRLTVLSDGAGVVVTNWEWEHQPDRSYGTSVLYVIDNDGSKVRYRLPGLVDSSVKPTVNADGTRIYMVSVGNTGTTIPSNQRHLTVIDTVAGTSHDVTFTGAGLITGPDSNRVYTISNENTLTVLDAEGVTVETVALNGTYRSGTITSDGGQLYLHDTEFSETGPGSSSIAVVDLDALTVTTIPLDEPAAQVIFSRDGAYAYAGLSTATERGTLTVIDTATSTVRGVVDIEGYVSDYAVTPDGRYVSVAAVDVSDYVLRLTTFDMQTSTTTTTDISRNFEWWSMGFTADGRQFYAGVVDYTDEWDESTFIYSVTSLRIPPPSGITVGTPASGTGVVTGSIDYTDADRDTLAYSVQTAPEHGTVTIDPATGEFIYTPGTSITTATSTSFTVIVDDGHGAKVPVTVTVPIAAANTAPTVTIRPIAGDYATGIVTYEATATDADGDPLTYTVTADPARATVVDNGDGTFTYTPTAAARHAASADDATYDDKWDTFTVTVTDPSGASGSAVATAMISPTNIAPAPGRTIIVTNSTTDEVGIVTGFTDPDGDPLTFSVTVDGSKGQTTVNPANGSVGFTPTAAAQHAAAAPNATAADLFALVTVTADDGHGGVTSRTYSAPIQPQNTAPTVTLTQLGGADAATGAVTYQAVGTDPDGDTLSYAVTANPTKGTLVRNSDGTYTYTPTVTARHDAALTAATTAQKQDTFTITATDGYGGTTAAATTVTISTRNAAPTLTLTQVGGVNATTGAAVFRLAGADADSDAVTYTVNIDPAKGAVVRNTNGTYTFTPTAAALHDAALTTATTEQKQGTFTITADDAHGGVTQATATVNLPAKNVRPTVSLTQVSTDASTGAITYRINGADADGDQLSYTVGTNPGKGGVVVNTDGTLTYTPTDAARHAASATGAATALKRDTFSIVANDGHGGTVTSATATATVSPRNAAPTVTLSQVGAIDPTTGASIYRADGVDPDGDSLTYTITTRPTKGTLVANADGTYTYTPTVAAAHAASADTATAAQLQDTFTVTANDAHGATTQASATATITPKNTAPTVTVTQSGSPNSTTGAVTYRVTGADIDRDALTYTIVADPTKGTLVRNSNGTYTYTPTVTARHDAAAVTATAEDKQDTFTVSIYDAHGGTVVTTVTAVVSPKNTAPTTLLTVNAPAADGTVTGNVGATDTDGDSLAYTVTTGPTKGSVVFDPTGGFTYVPTSTAQHAAAADGAPTAAKRDTFTVTVTDGYGGTRAVTVTAQIKPANANPGVTPTASSPTVNDGSIGGTVGGVDADSDTLTYAVVTRPGKGTLMLNPDGTFTYTPTAAARTTASRPTATAAQKQDMFSVRVRDGYGGSTLVTYTVPLSLTTSGPVIISANPPSPV